MRAALLVVLAACTVPHATPGASPSQPAAPNAPPAKPDEQPAAPVADLSKLDADGPVLDTKQDRDCSRVEKAIASWENAVAAYDTLLPEAEKEGWSVGTYNNKAIEYVNEHVPEGLGGGVSSTIDVGTDPCTCKTHGLDQQCAYYADHGFPSVICEATRAHEQVHHDQCERNKTLPAGDPMKWACPNDGKNHQSPAQLDHLEDEAYAKNLAIVRAYQKAHCKGTCSQMARASGWTGQIAVTFHRENRTNYTQETLDGGASYTSVMAVPHIKVNVNDYNRLWQGHATGYAHFDDREIQLEGGKPFTGSGAGPIVPDPPLGKFTAEILRLARTQHGTTETCKYAFETDAAIPSTWSDGTTPIDGVHVQLGELPIAEGTKVLDGTRTFPLPIDHFDFPGPAAMLPNEPIDWKARGHITGYLTIHWTFTPVP